MKNSLKNLEQSKSKFAFIQLEMNMEHIWTYFPQLKKLIKQKKYKIPKKLMQLLYTRIQNMQPFNSGNEKNLTRFYRNASMIF